MKACFTYCFVFFSLISGCSPQKDGEASDAKPVEPPEKRLVVGMTHKVFTYPVAVGTNATQETLSTAQRFSKFVTIKGIIRTPSIGGCNLSIDVTETRSEPEGYLILLRDSGGLVLASSTHELDKAYKALEKAAKFDDGKWLLPMPSVITSYASFH